MEESDAHTYRKVKEATNIIIITSFNGCLLEEVYWIKFNALSINGFRIVLCPPLYHFVSRKTTKSLQFSTAAYLFTELQCRWNILNARTQRGVSFGIRKGPKQVKGNMSIACSNVAYLYRFRGIRKGKPL